jgi:hypothetical protein
MLNLLNLFRVENNLRVFVSREMFFHCFKDYVVIVLMAGIRSDYPTVDGNDITFLDSHAVLI